MEQNKQNAASVKAEQKHVESKAESIDASASTAQGTSSKQPSSEDKRQNLPSLTARLRLHGQRHLDLYIGLALALLSYVSLRLTSPMVGFVRDEGYYFKAGEKYFGWYKLLWQNLWNGKFFDTFSDATILRFFDYNHEHPVLVKTLMGFSWWWTHDVLGITSNAEGFRVVGPFFAALTVAFTFALARRMRIARPFAVFAGLAWLLMPHNYFYSHLACFDVPVTAMSVLVVYTYLAGRKSFKAAIIAGLVFGLAVATKHNALFLPILFVMHWLMTQWKHFSFSRRQGGGLTLPPIPLVFFTMALLAPLIEYLHWPYLWHHPLERFGGYLAFHLHHENYPISFGQHLLLKPPFPFRFPFVMTAYTMPLLILFLALLGMFWALRVIAKDLHFNGLEFTKNASANDELTLASDRNSVDDDSPAAQLLLWGIMAVFPVVLIALPHVPIFGGVKHWQPSTPFMALFAAYSLERIVWNLKPWFSALPKLLQHSFGKHAWLVPSLFVGLVLLPSLVDTVHSHPFGMSFYNSLAGGTRGAAQKNLQRTFWGHSSRQLIIEELNRAPKGSRVFFNRTNYDSFRMYQRDGLLKRDVYYASKVENSDFALIFYQGGYYEELYKMWNSYGTHQPLRSISLDGVPLVALYARPGKKLQPTSK